LWLYWKDEAGTEKNGCLAIWNEYDLDYDADRFAPYAGGPAAPFAGDCPLTPAAHRFLYGVAEQWCEEANIRRENDESDDMPIVEIR
jgi:hypothetical protein